MKTQEALNKYLNSPLLSSKYIFPEFPLNNGQWRGAVVESRMKDKYPRRGYRISLHLDSIKLFELTRLMSDLKAIYRACSPGHDDRFDIELNINDGLFVYTELDYEALGGYTKYASTHPELVENFYRRKTVKYYLDVRVIGVPGKD